MYRVEQVLVPVDFSSHSKTALEFARQLSAPAEGAAPPPIQAVHAVRPMAKHLRNVLFPYAALGEDDREFEAELLEEARGELARYFGVDGNLSKRFLREPELRFGHPREEVTRWAGEHPADLVVLGAFGEGGSFVGGLGSTTRRFLQAATQPVAVVRDFDPRPKVRKILVAVDLGKETQEVLRVALGFALQQGASVEMLHVIPSPLIHDTNGILKKALKYSPEKVMESSRKTINALFERAVGALELPFAFREAAKTHLSTLMIESGDPGEVIAQRAYDGGYDLLVVGANNRQPPGKRSLGRVAERVLVEAGAHVMVVPASRARTPLVES